MKSRKIYLISIIFFAILAAVAFVSMFFVEAIFGEVSWQVIKGARFLLFILCIVSLTAIGIFIDAKEIMTGSKKLQEDQKENAPADANSKRA